MFRRSTSGRGGTSLGSAGVLVGLVVATVMGTPTPAVAGAPEVVAAADTSGLTAPARGIRAMKVTGSDTNATDAYGEDVAIDGDYAVVGAETYQTAPDVYAGGAYILHRTSAGWVEQAILTAADGARFDYFGASVDIDGSTVVVGAASALDNQGAAYVFSRDDETWAQEAVLVAPAADARQGFGTSVAISGDSVLVGALPLRGQAGAGYVFDRTSEGWVLAATLSDPDPEAEQQGEAVALDGDTAVVGASYSDVGPRGNEGTASVYVRSPGGWATQARLTALDPHGFERFGASLSLDGDTLAVGAPGITLPAQQAAYVLVRTDGVWSQQARFTPPAGEPRGSFGASVAIRGPVLLVGEPDATVAGSPAAGRVHVYTQTGGQWRPGRIIPSPEADALDSFGQSLALDVGTALVSAPSIADVPLPDRDEGYVVFYEPR